MPEKKQILGITIGAIVGFTIGYINRCNSGG